MTNALNDILKGLFFLILWMILGFGIDDLIASINTPVNASKSIGLTWLTVGIFISLLHVIIFCIIKKKMNIPLVIPSSLVVSLVCYTYMHDYNIEKNCTISESNSFKLAVEYIDGRKNYDSHYLKKEPRKLKGCKIGYEYKYRLVIVSDDGSVRLNR